MKQRPARPPVAERRPDVYCGDLFGDEPNRVTQLKHSPGRVRDAIVACLGAALGELSVSDIRRLVTARIGDVPASSVRSYLRLRPDMFERTQHGRYRLRSDPVAAPDHVGAASDPKREPVFVRNGAALYRDDCLEWLKRREPDSIHAVVTDPPYGLVEYSAVEQRKMRSGRGGVWRIPPSFDGHARSPVPRFTTLRARDLAQMREFFERFGRALSPVLVPGAHVFVASNPLVSHIVASGLAAAGLESRGMIVRLVMTMRGGDRPKNAHEEFSDVTVMPRSMAEPWLLFRRPLEGRVQDNLRKWGVGGLRRPSARRPFGDVIPSHPTRPPERRLAPHPSLKPQAFLRQVVRAALPFGRGVVLDPFAGSGSTLAAASHLGYRSIGVELSPEYAGMASTSLPKLEAIRCPDTPGSGGASECPVCGA